MNKKVFCWLLMAAVVLGLSMNVISCKDDDNDEEKNNNSEERNPDANPLDTDEAEVAWRWLCALTDAETLDDNWDKKSYEPTIGVASENNAYTRIEVVSNLDEAKTKFAALVDVKDSQLNGEYSFTQEGVGKMTWTSAAPGSDYLAEVAVDTKLIPHLSKIVYCTEDQVGLNGIFSTNVDGTAYYRLGDVIKDQTTGQYWVCVRPSFIQGDKGTSHWMCVFNSAVGNDLPDKNINTDWNDKAKYNNLTIKLPTKLKYSREHMNNFTNLIYALLDPQAYANKVDTTKTVQKNGLGGFDYTYHGINFLTEVASMWNQKYADIQQKNIWQILFNRTYQEMKEMTTMTLLYNGYHWRVGTTGTVHEYKAQKADGFQRKAPGSESGDKVVYHFGTQGYDITRYTSSPGADNAVDGPTQFNNGDYHWVVAYATGDQLMKNGKYSPYEAINGFEDIYRFNAYTVTQAHDPVMTEDSLNNFIKEQYAPMRGPFDVGDILFDETETSHWFCIKAPWIQAGNIQGPDRQLMFASFDAITTTADKKSATNVISEDDAVRVAMQMAAFYSLYTNQTSADSREQFHNDFLNATGLDFEQTFIERDTTLVFNKGQVTSHASSLFFNIAYNDGNPEHQAIMRVVLDNTFLGNNRYSPDPNWHVRLYKHYVSYDPDLATTDAENTLMEKEGWTKWQMPWVKTDKKILLQDVADQDLVNTYAKDKWVTLPLTGNNGERMPMRTTAYQGGQKVNNYFASNGNINNATMYNEPVLFLRIITMPYVEGKDHHISPEGHRLNMSNPINANPDPFFRKVLNYTWYNFYHNACEDHVHLDEQVYPLTPFESPDYNPDYK